MKRSSHPWQNLVALARTAPEPVAGPAAAPPGFATRVVAQAFARDRVAATAGLLEALALRGLFAAGAFSLAAVAFGFSSPPAGEEELAAILTDGVAELLLVESL